MGDLITLANHHTQHPTQPHPPRHTTPPAFYYDLGCPYSYLALERVDRLLPGVLWRPTLAENLHATDPWTDAAARATAERRAQELGLPLIWPAKNARSPRPAMRVALYAVERGPGAQFAIAAARLAFCGGYDLNDPAIIAEAAAGANLDPDHALRAAHNEQLDQTLEENGRILLAAAATRLPAFALNDHLHCGETNIAMAAAALRATRHGAGAA